MIGPLPKDLSTLTTAMRTRAGDLRDRRVTTLLGRWPSSLSPAESRELRRLWDERLRLARYTGAVRRRRRARSVPQTSSPGSVAR